MSYQDVLRQHSYVSDSLSTFGEAFVSWALSNEHTDEVVEAAYCDLDLPLQASVGKALDDREAQRLLDKRLDILDWLQEVENDGGEDAVAEALAGLQPHEVGQCIEAVEYFEKTDSQRAAQRVAIHKESEAFALRR